MRYTPQWCRWPERRQHRRARAPQSLPSGTAGVHSGHGVGRATLGRSGAVAPGSPGLWWPRGAAGPAQLQAQVDTQKGCPVTRQALPHTPPAAPSPHLRVCPPQLCPGVLGASRWRLCAETGWRLPGEVAITSRLRTVWPHGPSYARAARLAVGGDSGAGDVGDIQCARRREERKQGGERVWYVVWDLFIGFFSSVLVSAL